MLPENVSAAASTVSFLGKSRKRLHRNAELGRGYQMTGRPALQDGGNRLQALNVGNEPTISVGYRFQVGPDVIDFVNTTNE